MCVISAFSYHVMRTHHNGIVVPHKPSQCVDGGSESSYRHADFSRSDLRKKRRNTGTNKFLLRNKNTSLSKSQRPAVFFNGMGERNLNFLFLRQASSVSPFAQSPGPLGVTDVSTKQELDVAVFIKTKLYHPGSISFALVYIIRLL